MVLSSKLSTASNFLLKPVELYFALALFDAVQFLIYTKNASIPTYESCKTHQL